MKRRSLSRMVLALSLLAGSLAVPGVARAACSSGLQSCSTDYGVSQTYFGAGGDLNDCSSSYCAKSSVGELGVGNSKSPNYQAQAGFNTTDEPYLEAVVGDSQCGEYSATNFDFGNLSSSSTATANANFSVKTYLADGYSVQTYGSPPTYDGHAIATSSTPAASTVDSEQFGMNLAKNTAPASFGDNPKQLPDNTFSFGTVADNTPNDVYNQPNLYKYTSGDIIAGATQSSGTTCYFTSYIVNISPKTPAGHYEFNQSIVVTSTY